MSPLSHSFLFGSRFKPLLLASVLGCLLAEVPSVQAQQNAATEQYQSWNIPAQPLNAALVNWSQVSGVQLFVDAEQTRGLSSSPVSGRYSAAQALNRLLTGTGLVAQFLAPDRVTLIKSTGQQGALDLDSIAVSGTQNLGATTEDSGSYTTGSMNTATKLPLSIRETPQSVTIISRQRMDDRKIETLDDVLAEAPGITVQKAGSQRSYFYARGSAIDNIMYDGLPSSYSGYQSDSLASANMAMYDRVEIVRGSTGLTQGAGNPSAAINLVRKRPTADTRFSLTSSVGRWDDYRTELDASSSLNTNGTLRGRTVLVYQNKDSFQDYEETESALFYGILEFDLSPSTLLTLGASYQNDNKDGTGWSGLPVARDGSDLHLSRSTNLVSGSDFTDKDTTMVFGELNHRFENGWNLRFAANQIWSRMNMVGTNVYMNTDNSYRVDSGQYNYVNDQYSYDFFANGNFNFLGREHELVLGASDRSVYFDGHGGNTVYNQSMDPHDWTAGDYSKPEVNLNSYLYNTHTKQKGAYLTTRLNITDQLKFILGGRLDWYDNDLKYKASNSHTKYKVTREETHYLGLIYDLDTNHSVYASYTDIFQPQSNVDASGQIVAPIDGKNYELGLKGEYFDGALNASISIFQLDQENRAQALADQVNDCPSYPYTSCYEASGKVRSRGVDIEINGAITPNWQVGAGYSYISTKYKNDADESKEGTLFDTDIPQHLLKLSTTYQLPGSLNNWYVGGSLYHQNAIYNKGVSNGIDYYINQDAYTLVDLMLRYKINDNLDTRLNFNNVFDRKYYQTLSTSPTYGLNTYGNPRNAVLTVKYTY